MIVNTRPLSVETVKVFGALFKAQLPDTIAAIQRFIPEWKAVHVILEGAGRAGKVPSPDEMRDELLAALKPQAMLLEPFYTLTNPDIPKSAIATFVPDEVRPSFATRYEGWKYIHYKDAYSCLEGILDAAIDGLPEGHVGIGDALCKGEIKGQAVLEGWSMSTPLPTLKRTLEGLVEADSPVMFWDTNFGYESTGQSFLKGIDGIIGMLGANNDRVYFDAAGFSWFMVLYPGGEMRVGMLS